MAEPLASNSEFMAWYGPLARKLRIDPNPDAPEHYYDYGAFFRDMKAGKPGVISPDKPGGHFPSTYKTAGHPRTFLADQSGKAFDTRTGAYLDGAPVSQAALVRSERAPDMPGFDPEKAKVAAMAAGLSGVVPSAYANGQAERDLAMANALRNARGGR